MNKEYITDYKARLEKGLAEFFGEVAKEFLFDKDGPDPKEKLSAYYHSIVKRS